MTQQVPITMEVEEQTSHQLNRKYYVSWIQYALKMFSLELQFSPPFMQHW